jgi:imidazolonepropionase-like amidohydrolase
MCQYTSRYLPPRFHRLAGVLGACLSLACHASAPVNQPAHDATPLVLTHVRVFDPRTGTTFPDRAILIEGRFVKAVAPAESLAALREARRIDGRGSVVIPGLWDMHVHLALEGRAAAPQYVAHGVTTVRDMGGSVEAIDSLRRAIASGALVGPRIFAMGPQIENAATVAELLRGATADDSAHARRDRLVVSTPAEATRGVDSLAKLDVNGIKGRDFADAATYWAIANAARRHGLPLFGHAPWGLDVDPIALADSGQRSIEHWYYPNDLLSRPRADYERIVAAYARNRTALVPTLGAWRQHRFIVDSLERMMAAMRRDRRAADIPAVLWRNWEQDLERRRHERDGRPSTAAELGGWNRVLDDFARQVHVLLLAGVPILAGSDIPFARFSGEALQDEVVLLVREGGFTPAEALTSATLAPARLLGVADSLGTVAPGMVADLVVLDQDPVVDIENIRRVRAVMREGRWVWGRVP